MQAFQEIFKALAIAAYWYTGAYILTYTTSEASTAGLIGMINGLLLYQRVNKLSRTEVYVSKVLWASLFVPPPILAVIGLVFIGLSGLE